MTSSPAPCPEAQRAAALRQLAERFQLTTLLPALRACDALATGVEGFLDVAVFGQFKSGKSSLLNALLGREILPVGVVPVTAVITRCSAGSQWAASVTGRDGHVTHIGLDELADFVTEAGNPGNVRQIDVVDVWSPALLDLPGLRLVDTPGLGSVFAHNTQSTRDWLPNVAVALVAISADRPLSDEDRALIAELQQHAPRVTVVLTKVDLLAAAEREEVRNFLTAQLQAHGAPSIPVLLCSTRVHADHWIAAIKRDVLAPLTGDIRREREQVLQHKLQSVAEACRTYLHVARHAAQRAARDRHRLANAVFDESTQAAVTEEELDSVTQRLLVQCRPAFQETLLAHRAEIAERLRFALAAEISNWDGNLARQMQEFQQWMQRRLTAELEPASRTVLPLAEDLLEQAEARMRRVVEALQDRLRRNLTRETGITLSPVAWEVQRPALVAPPVAIGQLFMTRWELLWWLLPMRVIGGLFRRHCRRSINWEVEKNLLRLVSAWTEATGQCLRDLQTQARTWARSELDLLQRMLADPPEDLAAIQTALAALSDDPQ